MYTIPSKSHARRFGVASKWREIYMLADTAGNRRLIHRYIDVYEYPDGRIEVRAGKGALPYVR